jgi:hypothetical protein
MVKEFSHSFGNLASLRPLAESNLYLIRITFTDSQSAFLALIGQFPSVVVGAASDYISKVVTKKEG